MWMENGNEREGLLNAYLHENARMGNKRMNGVHFGNSFRNWPLPFARAPNFGAARSEAVVIKKKLCSFPSTVAPNTVLVKVLSHTPLATFMH